MSSVVQYRVVMASDIDALARKVNALIEDGWQLQGGVGVKPGWSYQAMFKDQPARLNKTIEEK